MEDAAGRAQVGADRHLGDDAVGGQLGDANAHQAGKERLDERLDGGDVVHGGGDAR